MMYRHRPRHGFRRSLWKPRPSSALLGFTWVAIVGFWVGVSL